MGAYRDGGGYIRYRCSPDCATNAALHNQESLPDILTELDTAIDELSDVVDNAVQEAKDLIVEERILDFTTEDLLLEVATSQEKKELAQIKKQYKKSLDRIAEYENTISVLTKTASHKPRKVITNSNNSDKSHTASAILHLSDLHIGSIIDGAYVNGRGYNPKMSAEFLEKITEGVKVFIKERTSSVPVDDLIINLGGDLVEIIDHGQQQLEVTEQVLLAQDLIYGVFKSLLELGIPIRSYVVSGNHDRLTKYHRVPTTKRTIRSFDWIIAQNLKRLLPEVDFTINESYVVTFDVKGNIFIMHHGDVVKGGSGIAGFFPSMAKWHYRRQQMQPFDYALVGHFHQSAFLQGKIIMNGALPGASGYTDNLAIDARKRGQNLIFVDSVYGVNAIHQLSV